MDYQLIATTTFGIEAVTAKELRQLGYEDLKLENGKVHFEGDEMDIAITNTWLRTADRVLIKVALHQLIWVNSQNLSFPLYR